MTAEAAVTVLVAADPEARELGRMLRLLVATADDRRAQADGPIRTWAVLGEVRTHDGLTENEHVVEHDRIGRQAVRLAVDKVLCVGPTRAVRALHQGAVMEGSWGDEARLAEDPADAASVLHADPDWTPQPGDVVLVAGPDVPLAEIVAGWRERLAREVVEVDTATGS
ncbi:UDP-N-acetylmuramoyl-tripeptide--D-alanyl-D-alanine ligase [Gordonia sp. NPDC003376]